MGYGFHYKTNQKSVEVANEWLQRQDEYHILKSYGYEIHFWSWDDEDEKENIMNHDVGEGYNNLSIALAHNADEVIEPWADLFSRIHSNAPFEVYILSSSCAITADGYFQGENLKKLTGNGKYLTGDMVEEVNNI